MKSKIIIGSRGSKLALIYAQNAKDKIVQNTSLNNDDIVINYMPWDFYPFINRFINFYRGTNKA